MTCSGIGQLNPLDKTHKSFHVYDKDRGGMNTALARVRVSSPTYFFSNVERSHLSMNL